MTRNDHFRRRAVSLTELLLALSMCTLILTTSGVLLHRVMRIESESRAFTDTEHSCTRLSQQFRSDVHQAATAELNQSDLRDGAFLRLHLPQDEIVEYGLEQGRVHRTASSGTKVTARDEFIIPLHARLTIKQLHSPNRLILSIAPPSIDATTDADHKLLSYRAIPDGVQIEAVLSRPSDMLLQGHQEQTK